MDIKTKKLLPGDVDDFSELIKLFGLVFEISAFKPPGKEYLQSLLINPGFLVFVATHKDKVVGGLTVYILPRYYSIKPSAYIYDVAVLNEYQRKGIGKQLISSLTDYCKENDFEEAYVEAETDDFQAVNFYRKTPVSSEIQATHFTYSFKKPKADQDEW